MPHLLLLAAISKIGLVNYKQTLKQANLTIIFAPVFTLAYIYGEQHESWAQFPAVHTKRVCEISILKLKGICYSKYMYIVN